jgi:hypothetical protein
MKLSNFTPSYSTSLITQTCLDVSLTVYHGTSMKQRQLDTLSLVCFIKSQCLYMFRALLAHLQEALHKCYLV